MTMTVPIGELATVTTAEKQPHSLEHYGQSATDAWEVWTLIHKRRLGGQFADEFTSMSYKGVNGFRWDGMLKRIAAARFNGMTDWRYVRIREWLTDTGNLVNVGGPGRQAVWWLRDRPWNDVMPHRHVTHDSVPPVLPEPNSADVRIRERGAGRWPCRFCKSPFADVQTAYAHERKYHPGEYLASAEYVCPVYQPDGGQCRHPATEGRGFGRHLLAAHGMEDAARRAETAQDARALARQVRKNLAAGQAVGPAEKTEEAVPVTVTVETAPVTAADDLPAEPAVSDTVTAGDADVVVQAADPAPAVIADVPVEAETPVPVRGGDAASEVISVSDARRGLRLLTDWLEGIEDREARLAADLAAARAERDRLAEWRAGIESVAMPFLDALTSNAGSN